METLGDYELLQLIGEGATGVVHRAEDRRSRQQVALKILHPEVTRTPEARAQMVGELRQLVALAHPSVVCCRECREIDGRVVLVYELVSGQTLRARFEREGRVEWHDAVRIAVQVAEALTAAHELAPPILHRDLRPENIMITVSNTVKVTDFGIARVLGATGQTTTATFGNITYMSPEQIDAFSIDARSDIYCLGLVLYELVTGAVPFRGSPRALVNAQCTQPPPPFSSSLQASVPAELEAVIRWMLEKSPDARPSSAREVSQVLRMVLAGEPVVIPAAARPAAAPAPTRQAAPPPVGAPAQIVTSKPQRSTPVALVVSLVAAVLIVGGLGLGYLAQSGDDARAPEVANGDDARAPEVVKQPATVTTPAAETSEQLLVNPKSGPEPTPDPEPQPTPSADPQDAGEDVAGTAATGTGVIGALLQDPDPVPIADDTTAVVETIDPAVEMLLGTHQCGIHWIDGRGTCEITREGDKLRIEGTQKRSGDYLDLRGTVVVKDDRVFFVEGQLNSRVSDCCGKREVSGRFEFERHGSRRYWRLQDPMRTKVCNGCTYYIDIFMK